MPTVDQIATTSTLAAMERTAARMASDPRFLAHALAEYCGGRIDYDRLARDLDTTRAAAVKLSLADMPQDASSLVTKAALLGIDIERVRNMLASMQLPTQ